MITPQLEICAADIHSVHAAAQGGANRVELCSGLAEGGMTPSIGLAEAALKEPELKVHVLIRPRPGDFLYSDEEVELMLSDIKAFRLLGVHGVVIGALTPDGDVDTGLCSQLIAAAGDMSITFHRAFDLTRSPQKAMEQIIALGCHRILTSGCAPSARQGVEMLAQLQRMAGDRLTILAGGGVTPANAAEIMKFGGVHELHASARSTMPSAMKFRHQGVSMGTPGTDEYARLTTDAAIVNKIVNAMK